MSSKVFLASSFLVEWAKKTKTDLYDYLIASNTYELCISQITLSEFVYYWLAVGGNEAPVTLKRDGIITDILQSYNPASLSTKFTWIDADQTIVSCTSTLWVNLKNGPQWRTIKFVIWKKNQSHKLSLNVRF